MSASPRLSGGALVSSRPTGTTPALVVSLPTVATDRMAVRCLLRRQAAVAADLGTSPSQRSTSAGSRSVQVGAGSQEVLDVRCRLPELPPAGSRTTTGERQAVLRRRGIDRRNRAEQILARRRPFDNRCFA